MSQPILIRRRTQVGGTNRQGNPIMDANFLGVDDLVGVAVAHLVTAAEILGGPTERW